VQNAPVAGKIAAFKYTEGQFLNAMRVDCAAVNENVFIGIETSEAGGQKVGVRLIAGVLARRIVPWVSPDDEVARGDRISLIQFGSRVELYLPMSVSIKTKLGDKVVGGRTVLAQFQ
jgi:phosphatidylserine decarboxylase